MVNTHLPLSKSLTDLIEKNSTNLSIDLKKHLEANNKLSEFEVDEIYPLLYDSLLKELAANFKSFNATSTYSIEIERWKYSEAEKCSYYDSLFLHTVSKLMVFRTAK
jgi:hypothetical protein